MSTLDVNADAAVNFQKGVENEKLAAKASRQSLGHTERVHNFSAGPGCLPGEILQEMADEALNYQGFGMSIMECSHRDANGPTQNVMSDASDLLRSMMNVPDNFHILFLHGGAHGQFAALPMNLAYESGKVDFVDSGVWSQKAMAEAKKSCDVNVCATFTKGIDSPDTWNYRSDAAYIHICMNETLSGIEFLEDIDMPADAPPVIADCTSTFLSRRIDFTKYGCIYASAGKNFGPAGVCIVIIRDDLINRQEHPLTPGLFNYKEQAKKCPISSIYNTPPVFQIYMTLKCLNFYNSLGGIAALEQRAKDRADRVYSIIDGSNGFFYNGVDAKDRSRMNVCFSIPSSPELEAMFVEESDKAGLYQLFKHPQFGGLRITMYNGLRDESVDAVCTFMTSFYKKHAESH